MRLEQLQAALDLVELPADMPTQAPTLHIRDIAFSRHISRCTYAMGKTTLAHAHAKRNTKHRGWICFSYLGLAQSNDDCLRSLAHELAHLYKPGLRHDSPEFQAAMKLFEAKLGVSDQPGWGLQE